MVSHGFPLFFHGFFHGFFKELDSKELEIHRYSFMDTINEYRWKSINECQWISINEFIDGPSMIIIDGPSMNVVPFLWFHFLGAFFRGGWCAGRRPRSICRWFGEKWLEEQIQSSYIYACPRPQIS